MQIKDGCTVSVHYTGTLTGGKVFDSSKDRDPLEFVMGSGMLIQGFESALLGKKVGDKVTASIPTDEAYGEHLKDLLMVIPRSELPEHIKPEIGLVIHVSAEIPNENGEPAEDQDMEVIIRKIDGDMITLDANHPLAGQDLSFEIEVISVKN